MPIPSRPAPVQPGEEVAGKYRVGRVLGAGAMGVVVRAWHIELEQEVALKFLHPELAMKVDGAERFRREARAAVRIRSDHVARVLDVGTLEGSHIPFIVMEYLQGRDLARELAARGSLPVDEAARHVLEACDAIGEAHARGIVHRDLKPANLFLAERSGGVQMIKVLDFGISKTLGNGPKGLSITEPATLMGSPGYMSPEQLESSRNVDARTDIWSLGVILQEMVTGCLPFDGDSVPQLIRAVISGNRPLLTEYGPAIAVLEPIVSRCLQQDRALRFQSISELKEALLPLASRATATPSVGAVAASSVAAPAMAPTMAGPPRAREPLSVPGSMDPIPPTVPAGAEAAGGAPNAAQGAAVSSGPAKVGKVVGGETTGAHGPGGTPDSAWGRTHGVGRAPLWRTLALAAALGATAAFAFWRGRAALNTLGTQPGSFLESRSEQEAAPEVESAAPALQPLPAPSAPPPSPGAAVSPAPSEPSATNTPAEPSASTAPTAQPPQPKVAPIGSVVTPPNATAPAPAAPVVASTRPAPPPVAAPQPKPAEPAGLDFGAALKAASGDSTAPSMDPNAPSEAPASPPAETSPPAEARPGAAPAAGATAPEDPALPAPAPPARNPYEIPEFGGRK
jgi:serine/threonine-protein kinase